MTSGYEGYPLASLESMSHGARCISYDIKYGPREQISDGVDGFLDRARRPAGVRRPAGRDDPRPELVARMSTAALVKAEQHDHRAFLRDWRSVIEAVVAQKASRVRFEGVDLDVRRLGLARAARAARAGSWRHGSWSSIPPHRTAGRVRREPAPARQGQAPDPGRRGRSPWTPSATGRAGSSAPGRRWTTGNGRSTYAPLIDLDDRLRRARRRGPDAAAAVARRVWSNASWETTLARPEGGATPLRAELCRTDGTLTMTRGSEGKR